MKQDGLKKNFIYQFLYQVIILVLPLITAPYLTRVLGDSNLGVYTYTYSIAYYFVVIAMLGIARHGQRILAARRNDEELVRKTFWSLYFVHVIFSLISFLFYLGFAYLQDENRNIYFIQSIYVFSALFDITWLFYGLENFKSVVIRNAFFRILETILIFIFVKNSDDLVVYTIIMTLSCCLSQVFLLPKAIKLVKPIKFSFQDAKEHLKPLLVLSITIIAVSLYTVFDKTLIGMMTNKENVAYYEYSDKIIRIPKIIIGVIGTIMFPRACASASVQDYSSLKKYVNSSFKFAYFVGFGSIFGILAISDLFAVEYYGDNFAICGRVMSVMVPLILIVSLGDIVRTQILIPLHKDLEYTICVILIALFNIGLSIIFIYYFGIYGAVYGTICSEFVGLLIQFYLCRKYLDFLAIIKNIIPFLISGLIMYFAIYGIKSIINSSMLHLLIQVIIGGMSYLLLLFLYYFFISSEKNDFRKSIKNSFIRFVKK